MLLATLGCFVVFGRLQLNNEFYVERLAWAGLFFYNGTIQNGDELKIEKLSYG